MSIIIKSGDSSDLLSVNAGGEVKASASVRGGVSGNLAEVTAAGELKTSISTMTAFGQPVVSIDPMPTFFDTFEGATFDTVNRWNTYGTVAATQAQGNGSINPSTTASASVAVSSQPLIPINSTVIVAGLITFEAGASTFGNHRFWGLGTVTGNVGTAAAPITDGIGFEVDTDGTLRASVYNTGARVFTQALTRPTDGYPHLYMVALRGDESFFYLDNPSTPIASSYLGAASQLMPMRMHSLNGASVTGNTPTFVVQGFTILDQARQSSGLSDGLLPWRKAKVDEFGALTIANRPSDSAVTATAGSGAGVTCTLPAAGPGHYHYITRIAIVRYAAAAITGSATPTTVTTTNLPGSLAWTVATAAAVGTLDRLDEQPPSSIRSSAVNTATTIVCPGVTSVVWRVTVQYYVGT